MILGLAALALAAIAGWQIGSFYLANIELRGDMKDLAAQGGAQIGLTSPSSDEDLVNAVVGKAKDLGIQLAPEQVTVERTRAAEKSVVYLSTDYEQHVNLLVLRSLSITAHRARRNSTLGRTSPIRRDLRSPTSRLLRGLRQSLNLRQYRVEKHQPSRRQPTVALPPSIAQARTELSPTLSACVWSRRSISGCPKNSRSSARSSGETPLKFCFASASSSFACVSSLSRYFPGPVAFTGVKIVVWQVRLAGACLA